jgi:hypothetical protein
MMSSITMKLSIFGDFLSRLNAYSAICSTSPEESRRFGSTTIIRLMRSASSDEYRLLIGLYSPRVMLLNRSIKLIFSFSLRKGERSYANS